MQFGDFVGNAALRESLSGAFSRGRLPHALILSGEEGLGKRTLAGILANAAVCRAPENAPCGVCPSCVRYKAGSHPDVRLITGSGASNSVSAESVETVLRDAYRRPEEADVSVYLFFIEGGISAAAQNKLLKLVEEPPPGVLFIFTVPSADMLLPTIRSRAQCFSLLPVGEEEAAAYVAGKTGMPPEAARFAAGLHRGNIGKMLSEGEEGLSARAVRTAEGMCRALASGGEHDLLVASAPLLKDKLLFSETMARAQSLFRDGCMLKSGMKNISSAMADTAQLLAGRLSVQSLLALCDCMLRYAGYRERNANMALLTTALCAEMRRLAGK